MATYSIDIITGLPYLITSDSGTTYQEPQAIPTNAVYGIDVITNEGYITTSLTGTTVTGLPVANPTNYVYGVDLVSDEPYVVGIDGKIPIHDYADLELINEFKIDNNLYKEFIYTGNDIIQINYYSALDKLKKLFTKDIISDVNGYVTSTTIKDEQTERTLTTIINYSDDTIINITKTIE